MPDLFCFSVTPILYMRLSGYCSLFPILYSFRAIFQKCYFNSFAGHTLVTRYLLLIPDNGLFVFLHLLKKCTKIPLIFSYYCFLFQYLRFTLHVLSSSSINSYYLITYFYLFFYLFSRNKSPIIYPKSNFLYSFFSVSKKMHKNLACLRFLLAPHTCSGYFGCFQAHSFFLRFIFAGSTPSLFPFYFSLIPRSLLQVYNSWYKLPLYWQGHPLK
jgi:hypothetical protein